MGRHPHRSIMCIAFAVILVASAEGAEAPLDRPSPVERACAVVRVRVHETWPDLPDRRAWAPRHCQSPGGERVHADVETLERVSGLAQIGQIVFQLPDRRAPEFPEVGKLVNTKTGQRDCTGKLLDSQGVPKVRLKSDCRLGNSNDELEELLPFVGAQRWYSAEFGGGEIVAGGGWEFVVRYRDGGEDGWSKLSERLPWLCARIVSKSDSGRIVRYDFTTLTWQTSDELSLIPIWTRTQPPVNCDAVPREDPRGFSLENAFVLMDKDGSIKPWKDINGVRELPKPNDVIPRRGTVAKVLVRPKAIRLERTGRVETGENFFASYEQRKPQVGKAILVGVRCGDCGCEAVWWREPGADFDRIIEDARAKEGYSAAGLCFSSSAPFRD